MMYEFEAPDGRRVELSYSMHEAPKIGSVVEVGGIKFTRVPSVPGRPVTGSKPHVSWGLDPYAHPEHRTRTDGSGGIPKGLIAFDSERERREFARKSLDTPTPVVLDS